MCFIYQYVFFHQCNAHDLGCILIKHVIIMLHQQNSSLQWSHKELDGVSNDQPHDCLLNRLFRLRSKKTSKPRITGLCAGNSPVTGEFPAQRASNAENVSIWWRHMWISPRQLPVRILEDPARDTAVSVTSCSVSSLCVSLTFLLLVAARVYCLPRLI